MNRLNILFVLLFVAGTAFAQVEVLPNGNLGIGTENPQYRLDVVGNARISESLILGSTNLISGIISTDTPISFRVQNTSTGFTGSSGWSNVSFGFGALNNPLAGGYNTAVGRNVLHVNAGNFNTGFGASALHSNTTGGGNTAVGSLALRANTTGRSNTALGASALHANTIGRFNTAIGSGAMELNKTGNSNTAVGDGAMLGNETGSGNTALGHGALMSNIRGSYNTAIGCFALVFNTYGNNNTAIGFGADVSLGNLNNVIVIGHGARATASNQVRIGNMLANNIGGSVSWTTFSDGRAKRSLRTEVPGLDFINRLNPVIYTLNLDVVDELMGIDRTQTFAFHSELDGERCFEQEQLHIEILEQERIAREIRQNQLQTGFIAQDVRAAAESIGYDFSGIVVDELGIYGLRYAEFVVPLVRAVQELSRQNEKLLARIEQLERGNIIGIPAPPPVQTMSAPAPASNDDWTSFDETASNRTAALYQNAPNPFRQATEIRFYLPQTVAAAFLIFYDLQGRQLHQITLTQRGEGAEIIQGSQFAPGIYLYALIADGQVAAVKRMIITE